MADLTDRLAAQRERQLAVRAMRDAEVRRETRRLGALLDEARHDPSTSLSTAAAAIGVHKSAADKMLKAYLRGDYDAEGGGDE